MSIFAIKGKKKSTSKKKKSSNKKSTSKKSSYGVGINKKTGKLKKGYKYAEGGKVVKC